MADLNVRNTFLDGLTARIDRTRGGRNPVLGQMGIPGRNYSGELVESPAPGIGAPDAVRGQKDQLMTMSVHKKTQSRRRFFAVFRRET